MDPSAMPFELIFLLAWGKGWAQHGRNVDGVGPCLSEVVGSHLQNRPGMFCVQAMAVGKLQKHPFVHPVVVDHAPRTVFRKCTDLGPCFAAVVGVFETTNRT